MLSQTAEAIPLMLESRGYHAGQQHQPRKGKNWLLLLKRISIVSVDRTYQSPRGIYVNKLSARKVRPLGGGDRCK